jgi:hypothetical protein
MRRNAGSDPSVPADLLAAQHFPARDQRILPVAGQHVLRQSFAKVVVPKLLDVPVAHLHALDLLDLIRRQRQRLGAGLQHLQLRPGIFLEVHGIDEQRPHRFGHQHQAVRAHQRGVMGPERLRQRLALLDQIDVARIRVGRDSARPAPAWARA